LLNIDAVGGDIAQEDVGDGAGGVVVALDAGSIG